MVANTCCTSHVSFRILTRVVHHPVQQEIAVKSFNSHADPLVWYQLIAVKLLLEVKGRSTCLVSKSLHMLHHHPVQQEIVVKSLLATSHASPSPGSTGNSRQVVVVGSEGPIHLFGSEGPIHLFGIKATSHASSPLASPSPGLTGNSRQVVVVGSEGPIHLFGITQLPSNRCCWKFGAIHLFGIRATLHASPSPGSTGNSRQVVVVGSEES
nr:hypothetical protein Itr_chr13CG11670 [Ipomoea trifida]